MRSPSDSDAVRDCVERTMASRYTLTQHALPRRAAAHFGSASPSVMDPLAEELQRELVAAQLCSTNLCRSTVYLPVKAAGFDRHTSGMGSRIGSIAATLHFARGLNRPLFVQHEPGGWAYTDKEHCAARDHTCYFHNLTNCPLKDVDDLFVFPDWFRWPFSLIVRDSWPNPLRGLQRFLWADSSIPLRYYWETTIVGRLIPAKYRDRGWFWYHSQLLFFSFQPLPEVVSIVDDNKALVSTGDGDAPGSFAAGRPVIAMHVRRGDKVNEKGSIVPFACYMAAAEQYRLKSGVRDIWLISDDSELAQFAKQMYPDFNFLHSTVNPRFGNTKLTTVAAIEAGQLNGRKAAMDGLTDILIAIECEYFIGTLSSNFGRTVLKLMYAFNNGQFPHHTLMDGYSHDWSGEPASWEMSHIPQLKPLPPKPLAKSGHNESSSYTEYFPQTQRVDELQCNNLWRMNSRKRQ